MLHDDARPSRQRPGGGQPGDDHQGSDGGGGREQSQRRCRPGVPAPGRDRDHDPECRGQHHRVRLERHRGAQRQPAAEQRGAATGLDPAGDAERAGEQEWTEEEVALARLPGAAGQVIEREEQGAGEGGQAAPRPGQDRHGERREGQPAEVEQPPGEIGRPEPA
jgi:hypothetical protein